MIFQVEDDLHVAVRRCGAHRVEEVGDLNRPLDAPNQRSQLVDDLDILRMNTRAEVGAEVLVINCGAVELLERVGLHELGEVDRLRVDILRWFVPWRR